MYEIFHATLFSLFYNIDCDLVINDGIHKNVEFSGEGPNKDQYKYI